MNGKDEILEALLTLQQATELGFKRVDERFAAQDTKLDRLERCVRDGFAAHDARFDRIEREMRDDFAGVNTRLDRLERQRGSRGGDRP